MRHLSVQNMRAGMGEGAHAAGDSDEYDVAPDCSMGMAHHASGSDGEDEHESDSDDEDDDLHIII